MIDIPFRRDNPPSRKTIEAALNPPEPDCLDMIEGGICEHGKNPHKVFGRVSYPTRQGTTPQTSLAYMDDRQQQAVLEQAGRNLEAMLAREQAAYEASMQPLPPDPYVVAEALNEVRDALHSQDATQLAEQEARIAQLEQIAGGR